MTTNSVTLGSRIRALRVAKGMSLRQLAQRLVVSAPFLCDVELDRRTPSPDRLMQLADVLGIPVGDLMAVHPSDGLRELCARVVADSRIIDGSLLP